MIACINTEKLTEITYSDICQKERKNKIFVIKLIRATDHIYC